MEKDEQIKDSIRFYTMDQEKCRMLKILMDPVSYLKWLNKVDETALKCGENFNKLLLIFEKEYVSNFDSKDLLSDFENTYFVKDSSSFCEVLNHLVNIFIKSYLNYYDSSVSMPNKLYRSITRSELEYLKKQNKINTLWSTSTSLDTAIGYTMEIAGHEWRPKEHFILEFYIKSKIPFIDVDKSAAKVFEPNEFILIPPFNISNLKLIKDGGMDNLGFYSSDNIPIYRATFKDKDKDSFVKNVSIKDIYTMYEQVVRKIEIYGELIELYLNKKIDGNIFHRQDYMIWAKNLELLVKMLQSYVAGEIRRDAIPELFFAPTKVLK